MNVGNFIIIASSFEVFKYKYSDDAEFRKYAKMEKEEALNSGERISNIQKNVKI